MINRSSLFYIGNKEFFRQKVEILGTPPNDFLQPLLDSAVDRIIQDLAVALTPKHFPILKGLTPQTNTRFDRSSVNSNLSKTIGLTGTNRNSRRGRGGGVQRAKTGRKSFKRTLSRRRRSGKFFTSKNVKL